jgi:hypothetical protein
MQGRLTSSATITAAGLTALVTGPIAGWLTWEKLADIQWRQNMTKNPNQLPQKTNDANLADNNESKPGTLQPPRMIEMFTPMSTPYNAGAV